MALSMDEQRMLAEIERRLAAKDPGLAARLSTFRRPGRVSVFRSTRARLIGSLFTVARGDGLSHGLRDRALSVRFAYLWQSSGDHRLQYGYRPGQAQRGAWHEPSQQFRSATRPSAKAKAKTSAGALAQASGSKETSPGTRDRRDGRPSGRPERGRPVIPAAPNPAGK